MGGGPDLPTARGFDATFFVVKNLRYQKVNSNSPIQITVYDFNQNQKLG